jgi:hypothetical protein
MPSLRCRSRQRRTMATSGTHRPQIAMREVILASSLPARSSVVRWAAWPPVSHPPAWSPMRCLRTKQTRASRSSDD